MYNISIAIAGAVACAINTQEVIPAEPEFMRMKERMLITGGNALEGEVRVSGGKNTAVAVIPAMLLSDEPCTIENLPDIEDVHALVDILRSLGRRVRMSRERL